MNDCAKCGKPKETGSSGSLTQWLSVCSCELAAPQEEQSLSVHICQTCGKRRHAGRVGSMTQWVFRQDMCHCGAPVSSHPPRSTLEIDTSDTGPEETEIEVDAQFFPLERYKPLKPLGSGAAGQVYLCRDRLLKKKVAVKTLRSLSSEQLISFQMEAKATSSLHHPNIVTILDFGVTDSAAPYMVLEFVNGESLERLIKRQQKLPWKSALRVLLQLSDALANAHAAGIYHRDLKPSNVLLSRDEHQKLQVRLIDFGVAKVKEAQEPTIVQGKTLAGTPAYMSPDQVAGKGFDARSEVYSLGCLLFECLEGNVPFDGATAFEILAMHANDPIPRLAVSDGEMPEGVQRIVDRCMAKEPDERYANMSELSAAIREVVSPQSQGDTTDGIFVESRIENEVPAKGVSDIGRRSGIIFTLIVVLCLCGLGFFATLSPETKPIEKATVGVSEDSKFEWARSKHKEDDWLIVKESKVVRDEDLKELSSRKALNVNLYGTEVKGPGLRYLSPETQNLRLDATPLKDEYFNYINKLTKLRSLSMSNTTVSLAGFKQLVDLDELECIEIAYCENIDDECVNFIVNRWPNLKEFQFGDTHCTGKILPVVSRMKGLKLLDAGGISATPEQWSSILQLTLRRLDLAASNFSSKNVPELCKMQSLKNMSVEGCRNITKADLTKLVQSLPRCKITSTDKADLQEFNPLLETLGTTE